MDGACEAALDQERETAAMIDVRVGEHHRVDFPGIERKLFPIPGMTLATPLDKTALKEDLQVTDPEDMAGAGDLAGGTVKLQFEGFGHLARVAI